MPEVDEPNGELPKTTEKIDLLHYRSMVNAFEAIGSDPAQGISSSARQQALEDLKQNRATVQLALRSPEHVHTALFSLGNIFYFHHNSLENTDQEAIRFASTVLTEALPVLDEFAMSPEQTLDHEYFILNVYNLVRYGSQEQKKLGIDLILKHFPEGIKDFATLSDRYFLLYGDILRSGDDDQVRRLQANSADVYERDLSPDKGDALAYFSQRLTDFGHLISENFLEKPINENEELYANRVLRGVVAFYFDDPDRVIRAWGASCPDADFGKFAVQNLAKVQEFEASFPGFCRYYESRRLFDFARYPHDDLIKSYQQRDNLQLKRGLIEFPYGDWKASYYEKQEALKQLSEGLGDEIGELFHESATTLDLAQDIINDSDMYGTLAFGVLGGHGAKNYLELSEIENKEFLAALESGSASRQISEFSLEEKIRYITKKEVTNADEYVRLLASRFDQGATVLLLSCSQANEEAFARELSKYGLRVVSTREKTSIKTINVSERKNGGVQLDATFYKGDTVIFENGEEIKDANENQ